MTVCISIRLVCRRRRVDRRRGRSVKNYVKEGEKNADRVVYRRREKISYECEHVLCFGNVVFGAAKKLLENDR